MKSLCALAAGLALSSVIAGCGHSPTPRYSDADIAEFNAPIECTNTEECERLWRRAQAWVVEQSGFKVQIATNSIIQTFNAPSYSTGWAFTVVRSPISKTTERFVVSPSCGDAPLCRKSKYEMVAAFHATLRPLKD